MLIESLGAGYAEDALYGTCFLYNGKPVTIRSVGHSQVMLIDLENENSFSVPADVFTGWKVFKYPRMGYRKLDNGLWGYLQRHARSYSRGLNSGNIAFSRTAWLNSNEGFEYIYHCIDQEWDDFVFRANEGTDYEECRVIMRAALLPQYDGGEVLAKVLAGEEKAFIPSHRFLVEPLYAKDVFGVYMSGTLIGRIDKKMNVYGPSKNVSIIENMVKRYAA